MIFVIYSRNNYTVILQQVLTVAEPERVEAGSAR
jgi:hypothetical protein